MFRGPPVQLICPKGLAIPYVPGHLYATYYTPNPTTILTPNGSPSHRSHILFELLKNSLRAVVERFGPEIEASSLPPIKVIVVEGTEDITIKISDEGGGIKRSAIPLVWTYMYTTMEGQDVNVDFQANDFNAPMAGFGYGLPLSRLVSRFYSFWMCGGRLTKA